ncbi:olfactory receptor 6C75-like [Latimeria chalumnae]|uniref:olfactory receptor 6C75-like n=1 Tax=Latimeria chalumnae TaxID=7897 RepID=UPI0003C109CA|nr:PREDICTED: olfactory receptor 6C75-like [Latimeria chalumnae]|eukprot:XP_006002468.1 PREDICTED: olfactory receptor 6C75-like [Latimeria chalumnae]
MDCNLSTNSRRNHTLQAPPSTVFGPILLVELPIWYTLLLAYAVICIVIVSSILSDKTLQQQPQAVLFSFKILCDLIYLVLIVVSSTTVFFSFYIPQLVCSILAALSGTTERIGVIFLTGLALDTYLAVCRPLHYESFRGLGKLYCGTGVMVTLAAIVPVVHETLLSGSTTSCAALESISGCSSAQLRETDRNLGSLSSLRIISFFVTIAICVTIIFFTYLSVLLERGLNSVSEGEKKKISRTISLHALQVGFTVSPALIHLSLEVAVGAAHVPPRVASVIETISSSIFTFALCPIPIICILFTQEVRERVLKKVTSKVVPLKLKRETQQ